jgi:hypothetical protein
MVPNTLGFGPHQIIAGGELWGTLIMLALAIAFASFLAAAVGRRRLAEIAENEAHAPHPAR